MHEMKTVKAPGLSKASLELIAASVGVRIQVMAEICQRVLDDLECRLNGLWYGGFNLCGYRVTSGTLAAIEL